MKSTSKVSPTIRAENYVYLNFYVAINSYYFMYHLNTKIIKQVHFSNAAEELFIKTLNSAGDLFIKYI